jgi:hypothetical protein
MANSQAHEETRKVRAISELPVPSHGSQPPPAFDSRSTGPKAAPPPGMFARGGSFALPRAPLAMRLVGACALLTLGVAIGLSLRTGRGVEPNAHAALAPIVLAEPVASAAPRELSDGAHRVTTVAPEELRIGDSELTLGASSELHVSGNDTNGWFLALDRGRVDCQIAPRRERPPFVVIAGETRVSVLGTRFSVEQRIDGTEVSVDEGRVSVEARGHTTELVPGESWKDTQEAPKAVQSLPLVKQKAPSTRAERAAAVAQKRFERAAALELSKPASALRIYRSLRKKPGPFAEAALYAEARLELELGHKKRARPLLTRYLKRYPDAANAGEARAMLGQTRSRR